MLVVGYTWKFSGDGALADERGGEIQGEDG